MTSSKIEDLLLRAYGSIKIIIFIFGLISTYANKNYIKLELGKKLFNLGFVIIFWIILLYSNLIQSLLKFKKIKFRNILILDII